MLQCDINYYRVTPLALATPNWLASNKLISLRCANGSRVSISQADVSHFWAVAWIFSKRSYIVEERYSLTDPRHRVRTPNSYFHDFTLVSSYNWVLPLNFASSKPNWLASDKLIVSSRYANLNATRVGLTQADMSNFWAMTSLSTKSNGMFSMFFITVAWIFRNSHIVASFSTDVHSPSVRRSHSWYSLRKETQWVPNYRLFMIPSDLQLKHKAEQLNKICF